jgi:hypothetical protein
MLLRGFRMRDLIKEGVKDGVDSRSSKKKYGRSSKCYSIASRVAGVTGSMVTRVA